MSLNINAAAWAPPTQFGETTQAALPASQPATAAMHVCTIKGPILPSAPLKPPPATRLLSSYAQFTPLHHPSTSAAGFHVLARNLRDAAAVSPPNQAHGFITFPASAVEESSDPIQTLDTFSLVCGGVLCPLYQDTGGPEWTEFASLLLIHSRDVAAVGFATCRKLEFFFALIKPNSGQAEAAYKRITQFLRSRLTVPKVVPIPAPKLLLQMLFSPTASCIIILPENQAEGGDALRGLQEGAKMADIDLCVASLNILPSDDESAAQLLRSAAYSCPRLTMPLENKDLFSRTLLFAFTLTVADLTAIDPRTGSNAHGVSLHRVGEHLRVSLSSMQELALFPSTIFDQRLHETSDSNQVAGVISLVEAPLPLPLPKAPQNAEAALSGLASLWAAGSFLTPIMQPRGTPSFWVNCETAYEIVNAREATVRSMVFAHHPWLLKALVCGLESSGITSWDNVLGCLKSDEIGLAITNGARSLLFCESSYPQKDHSEGTSPFIVPLTRGNYASCVARFASTNRSRHSQDTSDTVHHDGFMAIRRPQGPRGFLLALPETRSLYYVIPDVGGLWRFCNPSNPLTVTNVKAHLIRRLSELTSSLIVGIIPPMAWTGPALPFPPPHTITYTADLPYGPLSLLEIHLASSAQAPQQHKLVVVDTWLWVGKPLHHLTWPQRLAACQDNSQALHPAFAPEYVGGLEVDVRYCFRSPVGVAIVAVTSPQPLHTAYSAFLSSAHGDASMQRSATHQNVPPALPVDYNTQGIFIAPTMGTSAGASHTGTEWFSWQPPESVVATFVAGQPASGDVALSDGHGSAVGRIELHVLRQTDEEGGAVPINLLSKLATGESVNECCLASFGNEYADYFVDSTAPFLHASIASSKDEETQFNQQHGIQTQTTFLQPRIDPLTGFPVPSEQVSGVARRTQKSQRPVVKPGDLVQVMLRREADGAHWWEVLRALRLPVAPREGKLSYIHELRLGASTVPLLVLTGIATPTSGHAWTYSEGGLATGLVVSSATSVENLVADPNIDTAALEFLLGSAQAVCAGCGVVADEGHTVSAALAAIRAAAPHGAHQINSPTSPSSPNPNTNATDAAFSNNSAAALGVVGAAPAGSEKHQYFCDSCWAKLAGLGDCANCGAAAAAAGGHSLLEAPHSVFVSGARDKMSGRFYCHRCWRDFGRDPSTGDKTSLPQTEGATVIQPNLEEAARGTIKMSLKISLPDHPQQNDSSSTPVSPPRPNSSDLFPPTLVYALRIAIRRCVSDLAAAVSPLPATPAPLSRPPPTPVVVDLCVGRNSTSASAWSELWYLSAAGVQTGGGPLRPVFHGRGVLGVPTYAGFEAKASIVASSSSQSQSPVAIYCADCFSDDFWRTHLPRWSRVAASQFQQGGTHSHPATATVVSCFKPFAWMERVGVSTESIQRFFDDVQRTLRPSGYCCICVFDSSDHEDLEGSSWTTTLRADAVKRSQNLTETVSLEKTPTNEGVACGTFSLLPPHQRLSPTSPTETSPSSSKPELNPSQLLQNSVENYKLNRLAVYGRRPVGSRGTSPPPSECGVIGGPPPMSAAAVIRDLPATPLLDIVTAATRAGLHLLPDSAECHISSNEPNKLFKPRSATALDLLLETWGAANGGGVTVLATAGPDGGGGRADTTWMKAAKVASQTLPFVPPSVLLCDGDRKFLVRHKFLMFERLAEPLIAECDCEATRNNLPTSMHAAVAAAADVVAAAKAAISSNMVNPESAKHTSGPATPTSQHTQQLPPPPPSYEQTTALQQPHVVPSHHRGAAGRGSRGRNMGRPPPPGTVGAPPIHQFSSADSKRRGRGLGGE